jgi:hypothetical protein
LPSHEIGDIFSYWEGWENVQKGILKDKLTWKELTYKIIWGLQGIIRHWWVLMKHEN